jgi:glycosyltransferase involved in cell wall biosynthesis
MRIKTLALLSKYNLPSARLRFLDMIPYLTKYGVAIKAVSFAKDIFRIPQILSLFTYDVVIIQKKTSLNKIELFFIRKLSKKIIYDFDDATMFHELEHRKPLIGKNFMKFLNTINIVDAVVAGNDFLGSFCKSNVPNIFKLPTPVNTDIYFPLKKKKKKLVSLGWIGVPGSLIHLEKLLAILKKLSKKFPLELIVISKKDLIYNGLTIKNINWELNRENEYLNLIDIGLMPLDDSIWTNGKGGYKLIQYGAVALPSIGSPVGINKEIIIHNKTGFLASSSEEWERYLELLLKNTSLRNDMGREARKHIVRHYSLKTYARSYAAVIKKIASS